MKTDMEHIATLLIPELSKSLPGTEAQNRMAPSPRRGSHFSAQMKKAAVLIMMFPSHDGITIAFIRRAEYDGVHSGQISFPGGMYELRDKDLAETARRETSEETGIDPGEIRMLGKLSPLAVPVSNFMVYPYTGYLDNTPVFRPDPVEVNAMITIPLKVLLNPGIIQKEKWNLLNESVLVPFYRVENNRIWGATAMILSEFLEVISRAVPDHYFH